MKIPVVKNPFWLAMMGLGVILAGFFMFDIYGRWGKISKLRTDLIGGDPEGTALSEQSGDSVGQVQRLDRYIKRGHAVPTPDWLRQYADWKTKAQEEEKKCLDYYKQSDAKLEQWFTGLKIKAPAALPDEGDFKTHYDAALKTQIDELKKHNLEITDMPEDKALGFEEPTPANFKILQKRYWLQEKLFQAMVHSGVRRCNKINFNKKSSEIPAGLGVYIPFEIKVSLPGEAVAKFIYQILASGYESENQPLQSSPGGTGQNIIMTIKSIELSRPADEVSNYPEKIEETRYLDEKDNLTLPSLTGNPLVQLVINGSALDFDIK
ncbi:MAG: hypothetical protein AAB019_06390 [Planctomycetota bacterium]